jgi:CheY-like chemotaxis protein
VAVDGPSALDLAAERTFDLAFVDLAMPAMDGFEVGARLRERHPTLELVAVTGYGQPSDRDRTTAAGFDGHLVKPVDVHEVLAIAAKGRSASSVTAPPA